MSQSVPPPLPHRRNYTRSSHVEHLRAQLQELGYYDPFEKIQRRFFWMTALLVVFVIAFPYLLANAQAGNAFVFGGVLLNPVDGNTYLAKMYQGWRGDWQFTLPYTAQPGQGVYLNMLYILLGHLARWTGLSLPWVYNLARVLAALFCLWGLFSFFKSVYPRKSSWQWGFILAGFGAGMGWVALLSGRFTADFWVAEGFPLLASLTNPHFPLGLGLMLWLLTPSSRKGRAQLLWSVGAGIALGMVAPFGVVIVALVLGGWMLIEAWERLRRGESVGRVVSRLRAIPASYRLWGVVLGGTPVLAYQWLAIRGDALLSEWNAQNITPAPAWWDVGLSLAPALLLAVPGVRRAWRAENRPARLLVVWVVVGLLLLGVPFRLQRRMMMGLYIPVAGLGVLGVEELFRASRRRRRAWVALLLLSLPTNLIILLSAVQAARTHEPLLYLTRSEAQAFNWLKTHTPPDSLILAAPQTGLFIPAYTGRRVLYGHPFETPNAQFWEQAVADFFSGKIPETEAFLQANEVDYLFFGHRERELGLHPRSLGLSVIYHSGGITIYRVDTSE